MYTVLITYTLPSIALATLPSIHLGHPLPVSDATNRATEVEVGQLVL